MTARIEPPREDHGIMPWTGEFDSEARAIFECPKCGASVALGGYAERTYKRIARGKSLCNAPAFITLEIFRAALELELWPQASNTHGLIEAWTQAGNESPLVISNADMRLSDVS